jgi:hypothetical protein
MEATPFRSGAPDIAEMYRSKEGGAMADKRSSAAGPRSARGDLRKAPEAQEDWPWLATADPAFWLKGIDP